MKLPFCSKCGKELPEGSAFCPSCGTSVTAVPTTKPRPKRTAELLLGILGGIFGLLGAGFALFVGGLGGVFGMAGAKQIVTLGWLAIVASIIGLVGAGLVTSRTKLAGGLMLFAAILGLISISFGYLFATILLGIAGILALFRK